MDLRRQACLCYGGPKDHGEGVAEQADDSFDIDKTIFFTVKDPSMRRGIKRKFGVKVQWADPTALEIARLFGRLPAVPPVADAVVAFMRDECDFKLEHADGSFLDHLSFCHDYCAVHYRAGSPRVLLLHSALGVTTNLFPCPPSKSSRLAQLLSPLEMMHVQAFPAMQRLLNNFDLLETLEKDAHRLHLLDGITLHRVADNERMRLDAEQLWVQLNYQLIHFLDFLPLRDWSRQASAPTFQVFVILLRLLRGAGTLRAGVDMSSCGRDQDGDVISLDTVAQWAAADPQRRARRQHLRAYTQEFSSQIAHSLEFELH